MSNEIKQNKHKRKLLLLFVLLCVPVVVSYGLHFSGYRPGSVNYGELIEIKALKGDGINQVDNTIFRARDMLDRWTLLMVNSGNCDAACREKIYYMRQVRAVQHKEKHRVARVWLIFDNIPVDSVLKEEFEGTFFINARDSELLDGILSEESNYKHIYLVDPLGNLMMRFPENADPSLMAKDIKRLLHVSQLEH